MLCEDDPLFWFFALLGSGLFLIQSVLNFLGGSDLEEGNALDAGKFKWLTKQALTGFLMMFGWVGLTCRKEFALSGASSSLIALAGGLISMFLTGFIFKSARKLRSSGTVFNIEDAVGKTGVIYQRISKNGGGKVLVSFNDFTHEINAISQDCEHLPSFTSVQIIQKADENTVIVAPLDSYH